jgi:hypothetical protein
MGVKCLCLWITVVEGNKTGYSSELHTELSFRKGVRKVINKAK